MRSSRPLEELVIRFAAVRPPHLLFLPPRHSFISCLAIWLTSASKKLKVSPPMPSASSGAVDCKISLVSVEYRLINKYNYFITTMKFCLSVIVASLGAASAFAFNSGSSQVVANSFRTQKGAALAQPAFKNHFQTDDSTTALAATAAVSSDAIKTRGGGAMGGIDIRKCKKYCVL